MSADHQTHQPTDQQIRLHPVARIVLRRGEPAELDPLTQRLVDEHWSAVRAARSEVFDGPLVAAVDITPAPSAAAESVEVTWTATSYRYYLARYAASVPPFVRSLFVSVLLHTSDGRYVVGQMAGDTSNPGRLQLPGGNVDPPEPAAELLEQDLAAAARRELLEETGIDLRSELLRLWAVKTGGSHGDVGVIYANTDPPPVDDVHTAFTRHLHTEAAAGRAPEVTHLYLAGDPGDVEHLTAVRVDNLDAVLRWCEQEPGHAPGAGSGGIDLTLHRQIGS